MKIKPKIIAKITCIIMLISCVFFSPFCKSEMVKITEPEQQKIETMLEKAVTEARVKNATVNKSLEELISLAKKDNRYINYYYDYLEKEKGRQDKKGIVLLILVSSTNDSRLPDILVKRLYDEDKRARAIAIYYVSEFKITRAIPKLKEMATSDPSDKVRMLAKVAYLSIEDYNSKNNK